ncbi:hypothetical protein OPV22_032422 [Ensete ventricosum]|uniref:Uncharacterized protein n=1 Tax=Ensete ventricosum TaxID=4639 RepID=A0AAV8PMJ5_ENSVE|nr:hypothetical protein OPV22_032422 [Ensete ventricosum]
MRTLADIILFGVGVIFIDGGLLSHRMFMLISQCVPQEDLITMVREEPMRTLKEVRAVEEAVKRTEEEVSRIIEAVYGDVKEYRMTFSKMI